MSYQELPDPRPLGVRYSIGPLPRYGAVALLAVWITVGVVGLAGMVEDQDRFGTWGAIAVVAALLVAQTAYGIHWMSAHHAWPRHRTYRRHRHSKKPPAASSTVAGGRKD
jgi:hypothetical protein